MHDLPVCFGCKEKRNIVARGRMCAIDFIRYLSRRWCFVLNKYLVSRQVVDKSIVG